MSKILFVLTSADKTLQGNQTGYYLPEAAHPYYVLSPYFEIDFASPKGPNPPVDKSSVEAFAGDELCVKFHSQDPVVASKLANTIPLINIKSSDYKAIFYVGGHGPVIDLPNDAVNLKLAAEFYNSGKIVSAVCHGPAALAFVKDGTGESIWKDRKFTGFSNAEEEAMGRVKDVPFLLEDKIASQGGIYEKAEPWKPKVVVDGQLYTGQNPASAQPLAETILLALQK